MKRVFAVLLIVALAIGMLLPASVLAVTPATTCATTATEICLDNIEEGPVEGGNNDYCSMNQDGSPNYEEWDEWHFVITQITGTAPASITAEFDDAGDVIILLEGVTGGVAHYRTTGVYLDDTLLDACGTLPAGSCYGNFNLSHAPCSTTTTTTTETSATTSEITEVGGTILPISKGWMVAPMIVLAIAFLSVTGIIIWRRQAER